MNSPGFIRKTKEISKLFVVNSSISAEVVYETNLQQSLYPIHHYNTTSINKVQNVFTLFALH